MSCLNTSSFNIESHSHPLSSSPLPVAASSACLLTVSQNLSQASLKKPLSLAACRRSPTSVQGWHCRRKASTQPGYFGLLWFTGSTSTMRLKIWGGIQ